MEPAAILVQHLFSSLIFIDELVELGWTNLTTITWTNITQYEEVVVVSLVIGGYEAADISDELWDDFIYEIADVLNIAEDGITHETCSGDDECTAVLVIDTSAALTADSDDSWVIDLSSTEMYIIIGCSVFVVLVIVIAVCCVKSRNNRSRSKEWLQRYKTLMRESESNRVKAVSEVAMSSMTRNNDTIYNLEADSAMSPEVNRVGGSGFLRV